MKPSRKLDRMADRILIIPLIMILLLTLMALGVI